MLDTFFTFFSFGERAGGLANILQVLGALLALLSFFYGLIRYARHRQRRYHQRLEELLDEQAKTNVSLTAKLANLEFETPAGWLEAANRENDEVRAHHELLLAFTEATPALTAVCVRLAGFYMSLAFAEDAVLPVREARRWTRIAIALSPDNDQANAYREQLDALASRLHIRSAGDPMTPSESSDVALQWAGTTAEPASLVEHLTTLASENISSGLTHVAERLAWRAHAIAKVKLDPREWLSLSAHYHWAKALQGCGQYEEALKQLNSLLPMMAAVLGESDAATLATQALRALALNHLGRTSEALAEILKVTPMRRVVSGEDDPGTLSTRHQLAVILLSSGQADAACRELENLLAAETRVKGSDASDTVMTRQVYASALSQLGKDQDASQQFKLVLSALRRVYGPMGSHTLQTRFQFAVHHLNVGRAAQGTKELERLLQDMRTSLGTHHTFTRRAEDLLKKIKANEYTLGSTWAMFIGRGEQVPYSARRTS